MISVSIAVVSSAVPHLIKLEPDEEVDVKILFLVQVVSLDKKPKVILVIIAVCQVVF